jgi:hypothetical protein
MRQKPGWEAPNRTAEIDAEANINFSLLLAYLEATSKNPATSVASPNSLASS